MDRRTVPFLRRLLWAALPAAVIAAAGLFLSTLGTRTDQEALAEAEQSLRRAAVTCYALEGAYPTDVDHLYEIYGVSVDRERFIVHYEYVAANLAPDITVLPAL